MVPKHMLKLETKKIITMITQKATYLNLRINKTEKLTKFKVVEIRDIEGTDQHIAQLDLRHQHMY